MKQKIIIKTCLKLIATSVVVCMLCCLIALLFASFAKTPYFSVLFYVSIAVLVLGCFACMKGSPSSGYHGARSANPVMSTSSMDNSMSQTTEKDRGNSSYYKSFYENGVLETTCMRLSVILGSLLSILVAMVFDR